MLYLVRHAKAGDRAAWKGDDRLRPLSKEGRRQADSLARRLARLTTGDLVSSPYERCLQTVQPLSAVLRMRVREDDRLGEEQGFEGALALIGELPDGSVLCSHGDVIPETIDALIRRGCVIVGEPNWRKASTWVLTRDSAGHVVEATAWEPPEP
ncbi:MAG TPA: phosphoglycerate mutase family protein [Ilumatobacteraceae bacterium]|nr:phosphoglycerate mutase family protein [Ilumatobacteraceae bacterium]